MAISVDSEPTRRLPAQTLDRGNLAARCPVLFELRDGLLRELADVAETLLRSITWDQGSERRDT